MPSASGLISTSHGLSIGSLNVHSIGKQVAAVCDILALSNLDVLVLQATWHENADSVSLRRAAPPGYSVIKEVRRLSAARRPSECHVNHGGVAIIHRSTYKSSQILSLPQVKSSSLYAIVLMPTVMKICRRIDISTRIVVVAREFFTELTTFLEALVTYRCPVILLGDFNIHTERADDVRTCDQTYRSNDDI